MYSFAVRPELCLVPHGGAEDVAGRVVGQAQVFLQPLALRALAGPGRAEQDEVQLRHVADVHTGGRARARRPI